jgi:BolA protein
MNRVDKIKNRLLEAFTFEHLEIIDESAAHAGHSGAMQSGGGHYSAILVSPVFHEKTLIQRHQLVYRALGDLLRTDIHAFSMKALTPSEYSPQENY